VRAGAIASITRDAEFRSSIDNISFGNTNLIKMTVRYTPLRAIGTLILHSNKFATSIRLIANTNDLALVLCSKYILIIRT